MCKSPEAENWCFEGLNVLKEDLYICSVVRLEDKGLSLGSMGRRAGVVRSWVLSTTGMTSEFFDYKVGK